MKVHERIDALRREMEKEGIDIYIVPTADYHHSEYVGEYFKVRQFLTGFTGSAGTAVITKDKRDSGQTADILSRRTGSFPGAGSVCIGWVSRE